MSSVTQARSQSGATAVLSGVATTRRRRFLSRRWGQILIHALLIGMTLVVLLPFLWMLLGSFKTYDDLINRPSLPPSPATLANYKEIFQQANFGGAFINSAIVAVARVILACGTSVVLGYIFAKYQFRGKGLVFIVLLSTMLIPFPAILVPLYLTLSEFDLLNQISGLIVISVFSTFGTFLLRQWITGIPDSYIEAARMDGAGELWIIWRIIVPLSRTPLAALAIFTFLGSWDDYLFPNVVLTDPAVKTLPLALAGLKSLFWERYEIYCAGAMVTVVPVMLLYAFMQRHFVRGLTMGGTKE
jgi:ABC-type glycerol-3-phosphate transport system permease component